MAENENPNVTAEQNENYFTAYTNGVGIAHTIFDVQLHFSEVRVKSPQDVVNEAFATIIMSPQHAKLLLHHLKNNIDLYESRFGEIKMPEELFEEKTVEFPLAPSKQ